MRLVSCAGFTALLTAGFCILLPGLLEGCAGQSSPPAAPQPTPGTVESIKSPMTVWPATDTVEVSLEGPITSIPDALSKLPDTGGKVFVHDGTYSVDATILLKDRVALVGESTGAVLVAAHAGAPGHAFQMIANADPIGGNYGIRIEKLTVDGNNLGDIASIDGIALTAARDSVITNCTVRRCKGYNIVAFPGCKNVAISGNTSIAAGESGIEVFRSSMCVVDSNAIEGAGVDGLLVWANSTGNVISRNRIRNSQSNCMNVSFGASGNLIESNICAASPVGLLMDFDPRKIDGFPSEVTRDNLLVRNNISADETAIKLAKNSTDNIFQDNDLVGAGTSSTVQVSAGCDRNTFSGNRISAHSTANVGGRAITIDANDTVISKNSVYARLDILEGVGIFIGSNAVSNQIVGNTIETANSGIRVESIGRNLIASNRINTITNFAIIIPTPNQISLTDNTFTAPMKEVPIASN